MCKYGVAHPGGLLRACAEPSSLMGMHTQTGLSCPDQSCQRQNPPESKFCNMCGKPVLAQMLDSNETGLPEVLEADVNGDLQIIGFCTGKRR